MKIRSEHGVLYEQISKDESTEKYQMIGVEYADKIARANGYAHAEQIVKAIDGKDAMLDENLRIMLLEEDFLS